MCNSEAKSKESDLELKLNEIVVEGGRSLKSSMNRILMSVWQVTSRYPSSWGGGEALEEATLSHAI